MKRPAPKSNRRQAIDSIGSVRITRTLRAETPHAMRGDDGDCCLTAIQFKKLYPGDMTVTLTAGNGRKVTRTFTTKQPVRTAYFKPDGSADDKDDNGNETTVIPGALGRCVDVDIAIVDTASATLTIVHYHFKLCCSDRQVRKGTRLTHKDTPTAGGQVSTLPLLQITNVQPGPCPD